MKLVKELTVNLDMLCQCQILSEIVVKVDGRLAYGWTINTTGIGTSNIFESCAKDRSAFFHKVLTLR